MLGDLLKQGEDNRGVPEGEQTDGAAIATAGPQVKGEEFSSELYRVSQCSLEPFLFLLFPYALHLGGKVFTCVLRMPYSWLLFKGLSVKLFIINLIASQFINLQTSGFKILQRMATIEHPTKFKTVLK